jgi:predicted aminopeptidase
MSAVTSRAPVVDPQRAGKLLSVRGWLRALLFFPVLTIILCGCETLRYYSQAAAGQLSLLGRRQPIETLVADPGTPAELRDQLLLVQQLRTFALTSLHLPVDGQYGEYVDIERDYIVWNVFAAPELSLRARSWCFPVAGCVDYRGYFSESSARKFADDLAAEGLDTYVAGVTAYSTLGWMRDPVLNTFVFLPETDLANLIFHELAHQILYIPGDTLFNESFATTVALEGVRRWLHERGEAERYATYLREIARERDFLELVGGYRKSLDNVYRSDTEDGQKRRDKSRLIDELRRDYRRWEQRWGEVPGYRAWIEEPVNNAKLTAVSLYHDLVPQLQRVLLQENNQLTGFYRRCRQMAELDTATRLRLLTD